MDENMKRSQDYQLPPHRGVKSPETGQNNHPHHQPPPPQKCPRCDSSNTKFCYYNNYSLSQPRYFCKGCRRYWTHGGTLRNVPIGGCCRKNKRPKISAAASSSTQPSLPANPGMVSGQGLRQGMDPAMGHTNNSFYTHGGTLLSSLAALQSLPAGLNQPPPASLATVVGGGGGRFGANMALLQGMNLSSLRPPQQPPHHQFQNDFLPPQQSLMSNWTTQGFVNRGGAAPSAGGFWGGDQVGSSFNPNNQWSSDHTNNHHQGFDPSQ